MKITRVMAMIVVGFVVFAILQYGRTIGPFTKKRESFTQWPGTGVRAQPPFYTPAKESFVNKKCPDGTRTDGPCLLEFPTA